ncbi:hypothetical protein OCJ37_12465 [Xanthomonas sp. AM6]|uniref:hypothetical protein n=1 Tax=Xanthomonas sp. AM6 TaxID=2982531 RepID=UPI0021D86254|nr:hypothetical protein [Xanthomonas sp. AM6]UYB54432.1 hypothetical protein OCJ37_12465 [Xanthomonas sp. AM6]
MRPYLLLPLVGLFACGAAPCWAQDNEARNRVVVIENVKLDYAQVLNVEPVYQTLRATRTEQQCDAAPAPPPAPAPAKPEQDDSRLNRLMDSVKDIFSRRHEEPPPPAAAPAPAPPSSGRNCRVVEVGREFRRPIAYDVEYVYKGTKYRSRLPEDPGNRLRIRVSVAPYVPDALVVPPR